MHACDPSIWEAEVEGLHSKPAWASHQTVSKNKNKNIHEKTDIQIFLGGNFFKISLMSGLKEDSWVQKPVSAFNLLQPHINQPLQTPVYTWGNANEKTNCRLESLGKQLGPRDLPSCIEACCLPLWHVDPGSDSLPVAASVVRG